MQRHKRLLFQLLACCFLFTGALPIAARADDPPVSLPEAILALEAQGKLPEAFAALQTLPKNAAYAAHQANLKTAILARKSAGVLRDNGRFDKADATLESTLARMDPIVDAYITDAIFQDQAANQAAKQRGQSSVFGHIEELERADQLPQARTELESAKLRSASDQSPELERRRKALQDVLQTRAAAGNYRRQGENDQAQALLKAQIAKLDAVSDDALVSVLQKDLNRTGAAARQNAETFATANLAKADALLKSKDYDKAIATYGDVADRKPGEIAENFIQRGRQGRVDAETERLRALNPGFWREILTAISKGLQTLAQWMVYFIGAIFLMALLLWWKNSRPPLPGMALFLQDMTASSADREALSHTLTDEFAAALRNVGANMLSAQKVVVAEVMHGTSVGTLGPVVDEIAQIETLVQNTAPVQFGPLSINPKQLLDWFASLFRRPYQTMLTGSLSTLSNPTASSSDPDTQLVFIVEQSEYESLKNKKGGRANLFHKLRRTAPKQEQSAPDANDPHQSDLPKRWRVQVSGPGAYAQAIETVALQVAFDRAPSESTHVWESFLSYYKARTLLNASIEGEEDPAQVEEARKALRAALYYDPSNWLARFDLAVLLRRRGRYALSIDHLLLIERMVTETQAQLAATEKVGKREEAALSPLAKYLVREPEFSNTLRYNRALSLSEMQDEGSYHRALALLDALLCPEFSSYPLVQAGQQEAGRFPSQLKLLALSAKCATLVLGRERGRIKKEEAEENSAMIKDICKYLEDIPTTTPGLDWKTYSLAYSVSENAYGRDQMLSGTYTIAEEAFSKATMSAYYVDAFLNMAEFHMKVKKYMDWPTRAEDALNIVYAINPSNQKANLLSGRLYANPALAEYKKALEYYAKAPSYYRSYSSAARIQEDQFHDYNTALQALRRSLAMCGDADDRMLHFVQLTMTITRQVKAPDKPDRSLLEEARRRALALQKSGVDNLEKKAGELLVTINALLASIERETEALQTAAASELQYS